MKTYKVGIVGCGAILPRHLESLEDSVNFELVAICDIQDVLVKSLETKINATGYSDFNAMVLSKTIWLRIAFQLMLPQAEFILTGQKMWS